MLPNAKVLHNKYDRETLLKRLQQEPFKRRTISFYRYTALRDLEILRGKLYQTWEGLGCLGRIYLAPEGINAQMSVPEPSWAAFLNHLQDFLPDVPVKFAVEDQCESFLKLIVRLKKKIVADGLDDHSFDSSQVGRHLDAAEFNQALTEPGTIVVDMRNSYESEVGHFRGAILPDAVTFKEELPLVKDLLHDKKDRKILLYCTGGIRCEKASAWLKHEGFADVNQLHGGIIDYAKQVKEQNLDNHFIGKNFVFDARLGERVSGEVVAHCHICGIPADLQDNCVLQSCHTLFVACRACRTALRDHCSEDCLRLTEDPAASANSAGKVPLSAKVNKKRVPPRPSLNCQPNIDRL